MNHSRVKVNWGFSCIMKSRSNMSPNIYLSRELTWSMHTTLMIRNNEDDVEWLFCWNPLTSLWFVHVYFYLFKCSYSAFHVSNMMMLFYSSPHNVSAQLHIFLLISFSFLLFLLPSASNMASDQGQVLVIVTAAVGGFTLLVILTLFLLITGR